jgi:hypothetical protein
VLYAAAGLMTRRSLVKVSGNTVTAPMTERDVAMSVAFGNDDEALIDVQSGEMVIERFAKDLDGEANHGAVFWRGRMTTHYAPRTPTLDLSRVASGSPAKRATSERRPSGRLSSFRAENRCPARLTLRSALVILDA